MCRDTQATRAGVTGSPVTGWLLAGAVTACLVYSYWPVLTGLWAEWQTNSDYSAGQLVPLVVVYLLWRNRRRLSHIPVRPCWWGLLVLLVSVVARVLGTLLTYGSLEHLSLFLAVVGTVLVVLGYAVTRELFWVLLFMALMFPLPRRIHDSVAVPLQSFASSSAVYGLELLGYLVVREGNVLRPSQQTSVAVAEACSGLRMLTAFVMVAGVVAFMARRPAWQKAVLVLSSVPVAILTNSVRLVITVVLYDLLSGAVAEKFFHDFAGLTMMPFAVAVLMGELWLMRVLTRGASVGGKTSSNGPSETRGGRPALEA